MHEVEPSSIKHVKGSGEMWDVGCGMRDERGEPEPNKVLNSVPRHSNHLHHKPRTETPHLYIYLAFSHLFFSFLSLLFILFQHD